MAGHFNQLGGGDGEARRKLRERLARQETGDAAYDKQASYTDQRAFRIAGIVFVILCTVVFFSLE